jgi:transcriptional regulator with XRE-family HTH domain
MTRRRNPSVTYPRLRSRLIQLRERHGLSRQQFADRLGARPDYIWRIEMGLRDPRYGMMSRWAAALGATMDSFRGDDEAQSQSAAE